MKPLEGSTKSGPNGPTTARAHYDGLWQPDVHRTSEMPQNQQEMDEIFEFRPSFLVLDRTCPTDSDSNAYTRLCQVYANATRPGNQLLGDQQNRPQLRPKYPAQSPLVRMRSGMHWGPVDTNDKDRPDIISGNVLTSTQSKGREPAFFSVLVRDPKTAFLGFAWLLWNFGRRCPGCPGAMSLVGGAGYLGLFSD